MGKISSTLMKRGEHATPQRALRGGRCGWASWVAAGVGVYGAIQGGGSHGSQAASTAPTQASNSSTQQDQMSQDLFNFHAQNYRPLEQAAISDATKAGSPEMQEQRAAQAGTTVNTAFDNAQKSLTMRRDSMGIRPDSGATMDEERQNAIARAGGVAGAENTARQDERVYGLNAKTAVAGLGRNLPATALSGEAGAANAAGVAGQAALRNQELQNNQTSNIGSAIGGVSSAIRGMNTAPVATPTTSATIDTPPDYGTYFRKGGLVRPPSRTHGYKKGGAVRGPGSGTSDSIPVSIDGKPGAIANGEYVLNAKATKKIGLKRLDRMNLAGLPKGSQMKNGVHVEPVKKMADGGVADDVPRITITPKSGGKPLTQEDAKQMNRSVSPAPDATRTAPKFTLDQMPNSRGAVKPGSIAMKDGGVAGISSQTVAGIKKLDDEDDLETADMRKEPVRRADQGVSAPTKQTDAQKEQFRKLLRNRPDADKFKFKKGGAVKVDGDDEEEEDGEDTETLEKDLQYARGGKILPMPSRNGVSR